MTAVAPEPTAEEVKDLLKELEHETEVPYEHLDTAYDKNTKQRFWNGEDIPYVSEGGIAVKCHMVEESKSWTLVTLEYRDNEETYLVHKHYEDIAHKIAEIDRMEAP